MFKIFKKLICYIGWHGPKVNITTSQNDPLQFQLYAECNWCGFKGMLDSQGNLF